jgi:hypothetical protein
MGVTMIAGYKITNPYSQDLKFNFKNWAIKTDEIGKTSRSRTRSFNSMFQNLLNRFPLLERLLKL